MSCGSQITVATKGVRFTPIDAALWMLTAEERAFTRALYAVMHYVSEVGNLVPQRRLAVLH
jgi:hypothetical protein